ncbi:MAG: hypothetical protein WC709_01990 [Thermoleophilia bacterium]
MHIETGDDAAELPDPFLPFGIAQRESSVEHVGEILQIMGVPDEGSVELCRRSGELGEDWANKAAARWSGLLSGVDDARRTLTESFRKTATGLYRGGRRSKRR